MNYPFYTPQPPPQRPTKPVALPQSRRASQIRPEAYLPDDGLVNAVNVALLLGQPLLLTGEPGTGKTQLAYSLAYQLGLDLPLKFETKSTSTARDLFYFYDALSHFRAIQTQLRETAVEPLKYFTFNALGKAILLTQAADQIQPFLPSLDATYTDPRRSVVLIDEIDKAPRDFPNDILNEVENLYFRIPELGNVEIKADPNWSPILVLTSNSEKHLPDAFLRRCIYYHISFPDRERLVKIVETRLGDNLKQGSPFLNDALDIFGQLRQAGLRKKPATAELLNWLQVLREMFKEEENPLATNTLDRVKQTLSSLVKTEEDQEQEVAKQIVKQWLEKRE
jgi:MoxR-like ATPase